MARPASPSDAVDRMIERPPRSRARVLVAVAGAWLVLITFGAVAADLLPLQGYDDLVGPARKPPGYSWAQPLGTDQIGRNELSRLVFGARASLLVGIVAVAVGALTGGLLGVLAGYFRGWIDAVVSIVVDTMLAFPALILLLTITAVFSQSFWTLTIGLGVVTIPTFARLARASTMQFSQLEFVMAARAMGARRRRILFREIVPNIVLPVGSYAFLVVAVVIVAEGSLSYLGLGIKPPTPSWGGMIASGDLFRGAYLIFVPAAVLIMTVFSLNVVGDHVRRRFDSRESMLG